MDDLNEEILQPWADMLATKGMQRPGVQRPGPLSPFLEKELLKDADLSLDGGVFERDGLAAVRRPGWDTLGHAGLSETDGTWKWLILRRETRHGVGIQYDFWFFQPGTTALRGWYSDDLMGLHGMRSIFTIV